MNLMPRHLEWLPYVIDKSILPCLFKKHVYGFERERKKHWLVASHTLPNWDWACNLGVCPDREWNNRPFGIQEKAWPLPVWLIWLSIILYTKSLGIWFLVRAYTLGCKFPRGAHMGGNPPMFLSHIDVFPPSLHVSLKSIRISLGDDFKKEEDSRWEEQQMQWP